MKNLNRGVKGRHVMWQGLEWTVVRVGRDGLLHLHREERARDWYVGAIPRERVKFVRGNYQWKLELKRDDSCGGAR